MSAEECILCRLPIGHWSFDHLGAHVQHRFPSDCVRLLRAAHEHAIAHAYWRGMLARDIADAEREALELAADEAVKVCASPNAPGGLFVRGPAHYERRAARLREIADSEMWLPWWERRKAGAR